MALLAFARAWRRRRLSLSLSPAPPRWRADGTHDGPYAIDATRRPSTPSSRVRTPVSNVRDHVRVEDLDLRLYVQVPIFLRDSEGSDVLKPKLSKGPDRFVEIIKELNKSKNIHVILTGRKRDYLINELVKNKIKFSYFEMASFETINELYNCLDLYIVSSRFEGGPQAILECGITKTPIISTDVGVASEILASESIFNMENYLSAKPNVNHAYTEASKYEMKKVFELYNKMLQNLYEN